MEYLVILEITEFEELVSYSTDDTRLYAVIKAGDVATRLIQHMTTGQVIPLVVLMSSITLAFDDVYVTQASEAANAGEPSVQLSFEATAVRYI